MSRLKTSTILLHIAAWLLFMSIPILFMTQGQLPGDLNGSILYPYLQFCGVYMLVFYLHANWLVPVYFLKKKYLVYSLALLAMFAAVYFIKPFDSLIRQNQSDLARSFRPGHPDEGSHLGPGKPYFDPGSGPGSGPGFNMPPPDRPFPPGNDHIGPFRGNSLAHFDIISIFIFIMVVGLGSALQSMRQSQLFERRALQAEAEKAAAELSFLKAQINPHFLYNTLNNIYTLCLIDSADAAESIMKLSNIMRYVTDESEADFVPLSDEIDCISNFIALQKLRLGEKNTVIYTVTGDPSNYKITPLLLMTFIENAFKYGLSNHMEASITIHINVGDHKISFSAENQLFEHKELPTRKGIGIENTKKRLHYLYPDAHKLEIISTANFFKVLLVLDSK